MNDPKLDTLLRVHQKTTARRHNEAQIDLRNSNEQVKARVRELASRPRVNSILSTHCSTGALHIVDPDRSSFHRKHIIDPMPITPPSRITVL